MLRWARRYITIFKWCFMNDRKSHKLKKILCAIAVVISSLNTAASLASSATGKITIIIPHAGDQVFFNITNHSQTGCITTDTGRFRIDLTTHTGRAIYSLLLSAQAQDKELEVVGLGTCTGTREDVNYIVLSP